MCQRQNETLNNDMMLTTLARDHLYLRDDVEILKPDCKVPYCVRDQNLKDALQLAADTWVQRKPFHKEGQYQEEHLMKCRNVWTLHRKIFAVDAQLQRAQKTSPKSREQWRGSIRPLQKTRLKSPMDLHAHTHEGCRPTITGIVRRDRRLQSPCSTRYTAPPQTKS